MKAKINRLIKPFHKFRQQYKKSRRLRFGLFVIGFAAVSALIIINVRAASGLCSTSSVVGSATYSISVPETAQYRLWVRMQVPETSNSNNLNGVRVELAGSNNQCFTVTTTAANAVGQWQWLNTDASASSTQHVTSSLPAGNYTAKILGLKADVKVDKVLLLKSDNTCVPDNVISGSRNPGDNCTTAPPTVSLSANPSTVTSGSSTTLTWTVNNADSCTASGASGWTGSKSTSGGSLTLSNRTSTATYTLTCTNIGGSSNASATVTVNPAKAPTVNFSANPTSVVSGSSSTLSWTTTDATSCTASGASGWSGSKATSGNQSTGNLTSNQTYTLSCTGPGGTTNKSVSITVTSQPPPDDSTPPTVKVSIPGVTVADNQDSVVVRDQKGVTLQPLSSDSSGIKSVVVTINGQSVSGSEIKVGANANGDYEVKIVATDQADNTTTKTILIRIRHPDFNRSGSINIQDVSALLNRWNTNSTVYDINLNGRVDLSDLSYVLNRWGRTD